MASFTFNAGPSSPLTDPPSDCESELTVLTRSPSPPPGFRVRSLPSPSSSRRSSAKTSPAPEDMPSPPSSCDEDVRPAKRRKLSPTTDASGRTTHYLDLTQDVADEDKPQLQRLLNVLHKKRKIVVIAGAGISVSAGIPDFRSATGLFNSLKKEHGLKSSGKDLFDASVYQDGQSTATFHAMVRSLSTETKNAQPTAFHHLIATLAQEGRLMRLYTQNVDGIDTSMAPLKTEAPLPKKGPWPKTIQVHGGLDHMVCSKCHTLYPFNAALFDGPTAPPCESCVEIDVVRQAAEKRTHGIGCLRPRMVLYNEENPDAEAIGSCTATDMRMRPDAVIVAGTTLKVPGIRRIAREMCNIVRDRKDGVAVWINNDPEPLGVDLQNAWDLVVTGPCDEVARHAAMRKWDDPMEFKEISDAELVKAKESNRIEVIVGTPKKPGVFRDAGQLTPGQSPRMLPKSALKSEPGTPSKKGTKRKSGAQMDLLGNMAAKGAAKKPQTQPKKAAASKSKARKATKETPPINNMFKASKASTKPAAKATKKLPDVPDLSAPSTKPKAQPALIKKATEGIAVAKRETPSTPRGARVTKFKSGLVMQPLSDADRRNNQSPVRPEVEFLTPTKDRTPSEQIHEELARVHVSSYSRRSSSSSQRDEIVRPAKVPHSMGNLLC
ncbi:DHS-like NAD/FAD-binding domain-containing protein [Didymella exigua CBS 183.55]|uniref:DHS-like NAD/FAD-binding domain-containing protein n=1 Tax=Didymella exigua CBS 183.55 TaxID=1150837 RepID=A0A6A5RSB5_9PLEO|nr:DHS-like NAD/FAD-binding domain-containing protein [Didymella exigua CBS 183.55]KAF1930672.1 DHS-like NAD/FAD-binding domain-containing protein [Didymella exigua CBS 183.55]